MKPYNKSKKRQNQWLVLVVGLVLFLCLPKLTPVFAQKILAPNQPQILPIEAKAIIGNEIIELEIAKTSEQQSLGLMYRTSLPDNRGMLFNFYPPRITTFWMKNVIIYLDMIFLDKGEIKYIEANVPPCAQDPCPTYGPKATLIDQVIELRANRSTELEVKVGDVIEVEYF